MCSYRHNRFRLITRKERHTLAVAYLCSPLGDRLRQSDRDTLELFSEVAVWEHEAWLARYTDDTPVTDVIAQ